MNFKKKSIREIADIAGVSTATVSRVYNNSENVNNNTRQKVLGVINDYKYQPNEYARALFTNKSNTIGIIMPDITNHYYSKLFVEIEKAALAFKQQLVLCNTMNNGDLEINCLKNLAKKQIDGLILLGGSANELDHSETFKTIILNKYNNIPIITINGTLNIDGLEYASVNSKEYEAGIKLVEYLYELGHRDIGFLGGDINVTSTSVKIKALNDMKEKLGLTVKDCWIINSTYDYCGGQETFEELLKKDRLPTAIIAVNDYFASGILSRALKKGINVPEDISVIAFDDTLLSVVSFPNITTFSHRYKEIGVQVITLLNDMINKKVQHIDKNIFFDMDLIVRNSVKKV